MLPTDRQQRDAVDSLVEEFTQQGLSRRAFIQRAVALGLSASAATSILAACGNNNGGSSSVSSVNLLTTWGSTELDSFNAVVAPFKQQSGITVKVDATRDLDAILTTRIRGNNPPDLAILPNPAKMQQLASQNKLVALDSLVDMSKLQSDYAKTWLDLGSSNGKLYAIFYKAANKGTVWYSPKTFQSAGYTIPKTFDDMVSLSSRIAGSGKFPWSMGVSSGAASGWPATDWIAEILLNQSGPDVYDQWVAHKIPWTDSKIKSAFQEFGRIAFGKHFINGAPQSILATDPQPASYLPFQSPPAAYMYYLGDFAAGFITSQFKSIQPGTGFDFFAFPTINPQFQGGVTIGADLVVAMKNNNGVRDLVRYLATAPAQEIWVKRGGFTAVNKSVPLSAYPDKVAQASAQQLVSATAGKYGAGDIMPPAMQQAWWKGMLAYIGNQGSLDSVLASLENTAKSAYAS